ncbi:MAG: GTP-binding protein [Rubrivivax sp.]|nr:GTP-binding protein [Rubrivivax sp.]
MLRETAQDLLAEGGQAIRRLLAGLLMTDWPEGTRRALSFQLAATGSGAGAPQRTSDTLAALREADGADGANFDDAHSQPDRAIRAREHARVRVNAELRFGRGPNRGKSAHMLRLPPACTLPDPRSTLRRPTHAPAWRREEGVPMREYKSAEIRNIAVVGHGASGKTTLVDALAFVSGATRRHGSIKDGTTLTDTSPEEVAHGYSISLGCAYAEWRDSKINLLDTPGYADFAGDAIAGLVAADGALVTVGATGGVEVGTERMFREAVKRADPVLFVVAMMDKEYADFDKAYESIKARLTAKVVPVEIPIGAGAGFKGIINLFTKKAHLFKPGTKAGEYEEGRSRLGAGRDSSAITPRWWKPSPRPTTRCSRSSSPARRSRATSRCRP